jgi:hypothetical protein
MTAAQVATVSANSALSGDIVLAEWITCATVRGGRKLFENSLDRRNNPGRFGAILSTQHNERPQMGKHNQHLPRDDKNKATDGMDDRQSKGLGRRVANAQGKGTKQDAKEAVDNFRRK